MPVIRGESNVATLDPARRSKLVQLLKAELEGRGQAGGPIVFEVPLENGKGTDVIVIWGEWETTSSEDRSGIIREAYGPRGKDIALVVGVTYQEAIEQQVLPYAVVPIVRRGEVDPNKLREAMLSEGAVALPDGKIDLRFPSMPMAEAAHRRLVEKLRQGYWSIVQTVGPASLPKAWNV